MRCMVCKVYARHEMLRTVRSICAPEGGCAVTRARLVLIKHPERCSKVSSNQQQCQSLHMRRATFLTKSRTISRLSTSSASRQRPKASYVLRHSAKSAAFFVFSTSVSLLPRVSVSETTVDANVWSRSDDSVDLIRSIR